ncbi:alpha-galactosidase [Dyadobacter psychrotolerans]|uniref:Alpha-galactosidase n=1 Tax=Dyadobacter psychrotolerans TaxID=2541721 RepID=A0A4V2Z2W9_9BACT|nr:alpha-galactosidase [Dyadobacter psychrotolerans]TDE10518.1 alpha-galactosidase [Dyadobacter psychrotolerans]
MNYRSFFLFVLLLITGKPSKSQDLTSCRAILKNDTLTIENNFIRRDFVWNKGNLMTVSLTDKKKNKIWKWKNTAPDCAFPGHEKADGEGDLKVEKVIGKPNQSDHLEVIVTTKLGSLDVKRIYQIFTNTATISCTFYLKGTASQAWQNAETVSTTNAKNIESVKELTRPAASVPRMDKLSFQGNHFKLKSVLFSDITDRNNTLVNETELNLYRQAGYLKGNLLVIKELPTASNFFILKESPGSVVQLANPGFDFLAKNEDIQTVGLGVLPANLSQTDWLRCYGFTIGLGGTSELETLQALRSYQDVKRPRRTNRDDMILMNTWGDRNQDKKISEKFTVEEIKKAADLGMTYFQLDDGWQTGKSGNSAFKGGSFVGMHRNPDYWKPDVTRFPNGLKPIVDIAKKSGIELSLWFNPSTDSSFKNWDKDARALIGLYKQYGIRTFKIDGVLIEDKLAEVNFRSMLDSVLRDTGYEVVFNMDATAGRRNGYHYFNEYGNIFLENRYTDWTNYYPYWTLRNFWNLSRYMPAQNLQIEFLNKWRNTDKYPGGDPYAPAVYKFDYLFAITMMAQPLAWFEATSLPEEAFSTAKLIKSYGKLQSQIHSGQIFPIGDEPNGSEWTGFQSIISATKGYLLVFREDNAKKSKAVTTWFRQGEKVQFKPVLGSGKAFAASVSENGSISFTLTEKNSFALYEYQVSKSN